MVHKGNWSRHLAPIRLAIFVGHSLTISAKHTGKCKSTGGYYNELVQDKFRTGVGVNSGKGAQNLYLFTL